MKPPAFEYFRPASVQEAIGLLAAMPDAKPLAGGQSLIPAMNFRLAAPAGLVDLNGIAGLAGISRLGDGGLRLGAMTRHRAVEISPLIAVHAPLLAEAMPFIAHHQIRNRGTIGGSLAHADPAAELPAIGRIENKAAANQAFGAANSLATSGFITLPMALRGRVASDRSARGTL